MRFSKSTSRGVTKTGCVCESTNPGRTTLPAQSISVICLAVLLQPGVAQGIFGLADGDDFSAKAENRAIFDDAEFFERRSRGVGQICRRQNAA